jgi:hypothetical protein
MSTALDSTASALTLFMIRGDATGRLCQSAARVTLPYRLPDPAGPPVPLERPQLLRRRPGLLVVGGTPPELGGQGGPRNVFPRASSSGVGALGNRSGCVLVGDGREKQALGSCRAICPGSSPGARTRPFHLRRRHVVADELPSTISRGASRAQHDVDAVGELAIDPPAPGDARAH